jgi:hypothetical protein
MPKDVTPNDARTKTPPKPRSMSSIASTGQSAIAGLPLDDRASTLDAAIVKSLGEFGWTSRPRPMLPIRSSR